MKFFTTKLIFVIHKFSHKNTLLKCGRDYAKSHPPATKQPRYRRNDLFVFLRTLESPVYQTSLTNDLKKGVFKQQE